MELERLGFVVDSKGVETATLRINKALDSIERQIDSTTRSFNGLNKNARLENKLTAQVRGMEAALTGAQTKAASISRSIRDSFSGIEDGARRAATGTANAFERGFDRVKAKADGLRGSIQSALSGGGGDLLANGLGAVAGVAGVAGTALVGLARETARADAELLNLSRRSGLTVETLSTLQAAGRFAGLSLDQINEPLSKLQLKLGEAQRGNKELSAEFKALGVNLKGTTEQALTQIFRKLGQTNDETKRAVALSKIFEEEGVKLAGVIRTTGGELDAFKAKMNELGVVVDKDGAEAANRFEVQLTSLELRAKGLAHTLGRALLPVLDVAVGTLNSFANDPKGFLKDALKDVPSLIASGGKFSTGFLNSRLASDAAKSDKLAAALVEAGKPLDSPTDTGKKSGVSKTLSEAEKLNKELASINRELAVFANPQGAEFKTQTLIGDRRELLSQVGEIQRLRRELGQDQGAGFATQVIGGKELLDPRGIKTQLEFLRALKREGEETAKTIEKISEQLFKNREVKLTSALPAGLTDEIEARAKLTDILNESQTRANVGTVESKIVNSDLFAVLTKLNAAEAERIQLVARSRDVNETLRLATAGLRDELAGLQDPSRLGAVTRELVRAGVDLNDARAQETLGLAQQRDAYDVYQKSVEESTRKTEAFKQTVESLFQTLLDNPKNIFKELESLGKRFASRFLTDLVFGGNAGGASPGAGFGGSGGGATSGGSGGGGIFGAIQNAIGFRTPGFNPSASTPGTGNAGGGGGLNFGGGILGGLLNKGIGKLAGLFGFGGGGGATKIASGAVNAAKGGTSAGGGFLSALGFSNPVSAIITGGLIAAPFVAKLFGGLFGGGTEKELGRSIQSEYGLRTEREIQKAVKAIGDAEFRSSGGAKRNILGTIKLRPSKEALYEYALSTGQTENKLTREFELERNLGNPNFSANRFVKRETGGRVYPGTDYLVGEKRAEVVRFDSPGYVYPSVSDYAGRANGQDSARSNQVLLMVVSAVADLQNELARLRGIKPGQFLAMGAAENPQALATGAVRGFSESQPAQAEFNRVNGY